MTFHAMMRPFWNRLCYPFDMLDVIFGLLDAYVWFIAGPVAVYRLARRIRHPTPEEKAAASTSEMKRFWRNVRMLAACWIGLSIVSGLAAASPWFVIIAMVIGLLILPNLVERRFDKLVAELRPSFPTNP